MMGACCGRNGLRRRQIGFSNFFWEYQVWSGMSVVSEEFETYYCYYGCLEFCL